MLCARLHYYFLLVVATSCNPLCQNVCQQPCDGNGVGAGYQSSDCGGNIPFYPGTYPGYYGGNVPLMPYPNYPNRPNYPIYPNYPYFPNLPNYPGIYPAMPNQPPIVDVEDPDIGSYLTPRNHRPLKIVVDTSQSLKEWVCPADPRPRLSDAFENQIVIDGLVDCEHDEVCPNFPARQKCCFDHGVGRKVCKPAIPT